MLRSRAPRLSLDLLRGFRAAARHLSFTVAARELNVTQSAVSHEVKALEDQLGTALFVRMNRTLRLTHAGERLFRAADEALALVDAAAADVADERAVLSITATVPFASLWLGPRLPDFTRLHPDISLRVVASNDNLDLARERIDAAIRRFPVGANPQGAEHLFDYETFPVCSPSLVRSRPETLTQPADLAQHVLLDLETLRNGRPWYDWQQWLDAMHVRRLRPAGALRFSHYDQVIAAAIAGTGVALGRWPHLATHLHQKTLVAPLGAAGVARLGGFHFVTTAERMTEPVAALLQWLRSQAAEDGRLRRRHARPAAGRSTAASRTSRSGARLAEETR
jgi:DNA-binding transcriptional LysR family regulator